MADKGYIISVQKNTNPSADTYKKWFLLRQRKNGSMLETETVIYIGNTRKEVREYAEKNGINIDFMDSGRMPRGCKW